jgi:hypothetical protein
MIFFSRDPHELTRLWLPGSKILLINLPPMKVLKIRLKDRWGKGKYPTTNGLQIISYTLIYDLDFSLKGKRPFFISQSQTHTSLESTFVVLLCNDNFNKYSSSYCFFQKSMYFNPNSFWNIKFNSSFCATNPFQFRQFNAFWSERKIRGRKEVWSSACCLTNLHQNVAFVISRIDKEHFYSPICWSRQLVDYLHGNKF